MAAQPKNHEVFLTLDGIHKLETELEYLKSEKRQDVAARIKVATSFGDLSENAEYDEAKNEQAFVEGRIMMIENMLRLAKVVSEEDVRTDVVNVGARIKVLDMDENEEIDYAIVGSAEADPLADRISNESPLGYALMGHAVGEEITVQLPGGATRRLKVLSISK